jgi:hypothetical protein
VQIAPETCRANVVKKEIKNTVHLVGLELNMYVTKMYGTTNIKFIVYVGFSLSHANKSASLWLITLPESIQFHINYTQHIKTLTVTVGFVA